MSLKIKYLDVPYGAQESAQAIGNGQSFTDMSLVSVGAPDTCYATLEPFGWPLDGKRGLIPDSPTAGFWSKKRSDTEGGFAEPPILTLSFQENYTATGVTITFSPGTDEWCSKIRITWYNGEIQLDQMDAYPDSSHWTLNHAVENFDGLTVELIQTNKPGSFAKVQCIEIGQTIWFGPGEIVNPQLTNEIDPSLSTLTVDTMKVNIRDRNNRQLIPQKNQQMELYQNDKLLAVQYITESSRESKQYYTFSCQSAIGLLEDTFLGGVYTAVPVNDVLEEILGEVLFVLNEAFAGETITGYLPVCTRREALQQVAFAIGAVVSTQIRQDTQRRRSIQIDPITTEVSTKFENSDIFQGSKLETAQRIAKIEVVSHSYTPSEEIETLLNEEDLSGEEVLMTFDQPHHSYEIAGGEITGFGSNWITIKASEKVTLTAKKYTHSTVRHTKHNPVTAAERNNTQSVENVTLVHSGNVSNILERLAEIAQLRQTLTQDVVITGQQAGQKVVSHSPWGGQIRGYITSMESTFTNAGHTASITILGEEEGLR